MEKLVDMVLNVYFGCFKKEDIDLQEAFVYMVVCWIY